MIKPNSVIHRFLYAFENLEVKGNEADGYWARFKRDPVGMWSANRQAAIAGCAQRRMEVLEKRVRRTSTDFLRVSGT